jgi:hypothetical protein
MTLAIPPYLQVPGIQDRRVHYAWDDWNVEAVDMPLEPVLQDVLQRLSQRAIVAFTIATAEWIVHRFGTLSDDPVPSQVIEAAWAQVVNFRYSTHSDIARAEWRGPVRGPLGTAIRRVRFAVQQAENCGEPAWRAGRASRLAEHVLPDPAPFVLWRERTLERLQTTSPADSEEKLGEVVPREALDPDAAVAVEQTEMLINRFLASLDYRTNPFLASPDEMLQRGFEGTPYRFDIAEDRRNRYEW